MTENLDSQARKSAVSVALVLLAIAGWNFYRDRPNLWMGFGGAGALLLLAGIALPPVARAFHKAWMKIAHVLGAINSRIILSIAFYLVMTPIGLLTRLLGRDPLDRRGKARSTYWVPRKRSRQTREGFERLF